MIINSQSIIEDFVDCESEGGFLSEEFIPFTQSFYFDGTENCGIAGDVNLDNSINVLDVMHVVNIILEQTIEFQIDLDLELQLEFSPIFKLNYNLLKTKKASKLDAFKVNLF